MPLSYEQRNAIQAYKAFLGERDDDGRRDFVDVARRIEDWPGEGFLRGHARKWGLGRQAEEYAQWAYDIKNRAGVQVYAYVHVAYGNRGLAFVDIQQDVVVQVDCDSSLNFDCLSPPNGARRWAADKVAMGTHWRLPETER